MRACVNVFRCRWSIPATCRVAACHPRDAEIEEPSHEDGRCPDGVPWWRKVKRKSLPPEFWEKRRKENNQNRGRRGKQNRRARAALEQHAAGVAEGVVAEAGDGAQAAKLGHTQEAREARVQASLFQRARFQAAMESGLNVVVECGMAPGSQMAPREVRSLAKQLETAAGVNRKHATPVRLTFTSFDGALRDFAASMHAANWKAHAHVEPATTVFADADKVTVLSPDAEHDLEDLDYERVYIIGGIVDRTVRKNMTRYYAQEHGYQTRRLPLLANVEFIGEGKPHGKWNVLNVDDVVRALLEFKRTKDWRVACNAAIPLRKRRLD